MAARSRTQKPVNIEPVQKAMIEREQSMEVRNLQLHQKGLAEKYRKEDKVEVTISPMYRPHFGNKMPVIINGIPIYVPCDGKAYKIPKTYAGVVKGRVRHVDDQIKRAARLSNVRENVEEYAGQKDLIGRA